MLLNIETLTILILSLLQQGGYR